MKWAAEEITKFDNISIAKVLEGPFLLNAKEFESGAEPVIITAEDLEIITDEIPGYEVASKGSLTVALDIHFTEDLKRKAMQGNL